MPEDDDAQYCGVKVKVSGVQFLIQTRLCSHLLVQDIALYSIKTSSLCLGYIMLSIQMKLIDQS